MISYFHKNKFYGYSFELPQPCSNKFFHVYFYIEKFEKIWINLVEEFAILSRAFYGILTIISMFSMLWANIMENKLIFFLIFPRK